MFYPEGEPEGPFDACDLHVTKAGLQLDAHAAKALDCLAYKVGHIDDPASILTSKKRPDLPRSACLSEPPCPPTDYERDAVGGHRSFNGAAQLIGQVIDGNAHHELTSALGYPDTGYLGEPTRLAEQAALNAAVCRLDLRIRADGVCHSQPLRRGEERPKPLGLSLVVAGEQDDENLAFEGHTAERRITGNGGMNGVGVSHLLHEQSLPASWPERTVM
jgi:hypothetical protein